MVVLCLLQRKSWKRMWEIELEGQVVVELVVVVEVQVVLEDL